MKDEKVAIVPPAAVLAGRSNSGLSEQDAIGIFASEVWKVLTDGERAILQLWEDRCIMPFGEFQLALERTLGRPVFTHELLYRDQLKLELLNALGRFPHA